MILEGNHLHKVYGQGENQVSVINDVHFGAKQGEFVAIVGKSGAGKSTLMHIIGGLEPPTKGEVLIKGTSVYDLKADERAIFRRREIGFVFQAFNLVPSLNVWENTLLPIGLDGKEPDLPFVEDVLATLGVETKKTSLPASLSGGQQQRVAIARALAPKPAIILADEPTGNLDSRTSKDVLELLRVSVSKYGQTIIMVTHNEEIAGLADRIVKVEDGQVMTES
ncbi:ABC transporter ATP-binding protein [Paenibacillus hubeiensis]|nr:putative ABC transporter ATP-binding protein [Paenibacillus sp. JJ-223]